MSGADAWAFLVARGRRKGYRTVLAPDFLARRGLQGVLSEQVDGDDTNSAGYGTVTLDTPVGVLTVLSRTRQVVSSEVAGDTVGKPDQADLPVTDEHGRPLELLYGFVCRVSAVHEVSEDDFREALDRSLQAYRWFLADEDRPVEESRAFPMRTSVSPVQTPAAPVFRPPADPGARFISTNPQPARSAPDPVLHTLRPSTLRRPVVGIAVLGIVLTVIVGLLVWRGRGPDVEVICPQADPSSSRQDSAIVEVRVTHASGSVSMKIDSPATARRESEKGVTRFLVENVPAEGRTGYTVIVTDSEGTQQRKQGSLSCGG